MRKSTCLFAALLLFFSIFLIIIMNFFKSNDIATKPALADTVFVDVDNYSWAMDAINYLNNKGILNGITQTEFFPSNHVTKEQFAKMIALCMNVPMQTGTSGFADVKYNRWSYSYIEATKEFFIHDTNYYPEQQMKREDIAAVIVKASKLDRGSNAGLFVNDEALNNKFKDAQEISPELREFVAIAVESGFLIGENGFIKPRDYVTRAEAAVILYRLYDEQLTPIVSKTQVSVEKAKQWAATKNADRRFIDIADLYWKYGELTGINPEVLYCQSAKETAFGRYSGVVLPEQNNWAGIKCRDATGDAILDHESFETPEDGVRAHFNHMGAYVGLEPIGQPHGRYNVVKNLAWAGTIKYVEELGGRWAPDSNYGYSIREYLDALYKL